MTDLRRPNDDAYVLPGTRLAAGTYPGSKPTVRAADRDAKLAAFLDAGVTAFVDLTDPLDPIAPYASYLLAVAKRRGIEVHHDRLTIRDASICTPDHMHTVLDTIDTRLAEGHGVYVHCWGGIGRTGLVVGCWLVRHGRTGDEALHIVQQLFRTMSPAKVAAHSAWGSPETTEQREMVRNWATLSRT